MDSSKMDEFVANAALLAAHLKEKCEQAAASQQASAQDLQGAAIVVRKTIEEGKRGLVEHAGSAVSSALSEKVPAATQAILDTTARLKVLKTEEPSGRKAGVKVKSVAELVDKLKNEAGVL